MSPVPPNPALASAPIRTPSPPKHPSPLLRFKIQDLSHPAVPRFLSSIDASKALSSAVTTVLSLLYPATPHWQQVRSITLVLRAMDGVAYTTGKEIDDMHKEIHLALPYIGGIDDARVVDEITGVLVHEMVHCWQWNGLGSAPGGLIEGIADWVRLKAGHAPPHWRKEGDGDWDAGYQHTGYFLEWLEGRFGADVVVRVNEALRGQRYHEDTFWRKIAGAPVGELWKEYGESLK